MNLLIPVCVMAILVGGIAAGFIFASVFLGPKKHNPVKDTPFECGLPSQGFGHRTMSVRFYLMALLFIVFDVDLAFLFPWAVVFRDLGIYAWKIGALEWD
jgi:NADH-quinone oxidoreductase subunit A